MERRSWTILSDKDTVPIPSSSTCSPRIDREQFHLTEASLQTAKDKLDREKTAVPHLTTPEKLDKSQDGDAEELASKTTHFI